MTPTFSLSLSHLRDGGAGERNDNSHNVDRELELKELGDAVVDVAAPHDRLDDAAEVVVRQNNVRRLLRHISTSDTLRGTR